WRTPSAAVPLPGWLHAQPESAAESGLRQPDLLPAALAAGRASPPPTFPPPSFTRSDSLPQALRLPGRPQRSSLREVSEIRLVSIQNLREPEKHRRRITDERVVRPVSGHAADEVREG